MLNLSRRSVLAGLAAGALLPQVAASSSAIMIASNNEALDDLLRDRIDPSMRKGHGAEVLHDGVVDPADLLRAGASGERQARMYDVLCLDDIAMCAMTRAGLLSQITQERLPSLGQIPLSGLTSIVVVHLPMRSFITHFICQIRHDRLPTCGRNRNRGGSDCPGRTSLRMRSTRRGRRPSPERSRLLEKSVSYLEVARCDDVFVRRSNGRRAF